MTTQQALIKRIPKGGTRSVKGLARQLTYLSRRKDAEREDVDLRLAQRHELDPDNPDTVDPNTDPWAFARRVYEQSGLLPPDDPDGELDRELTMHFVISLPPDTENVRTVNENVRLAEMIGRDWAESVFAAGYRNDQGVVERFDYITAFHHHEQDQNHLHTHVIVVRSPLGGGNLLRLSEGHPHWSYEAMRLKAVEAADRHGLPLVATTRADRGIVERRLSDFEYRRSHHSPENQAAGNRNGRRRTRAGIAYFDPEFDAAGIAPNDNESDFEGNGDDLRRGCTPMFAAQRDDDLLPDFDLASHSGDGMSGNTSDNSGDLCDSARRAGPTGEKRTGGDESSLGDGGEDTPVTRRAFGDGQSADYVTDGAPGKRRRIGERRFGPDLATFDEEGEAGVPHDRSGDLHDRMQTGFSGEEDARSQASFVGEQQIAGYRNGSTGEKRTGGDESPLGDGGDDTPVTRGGFDDGRSADYVTGGAPGKRRRIGERRFGPDLATCHEEGVAGIPYDRSDDLHNRMQMGSSGEENARSQAAFVGEQQTAGYRNGSTGEKRTGDDESPLGDGGDNTPDTRRGFGDGRSADYVTDGAPGKRRRIGERCFGLDLATFDEEGVAGVPHDRSDDLHDRMQMGSSGGENARSQAAFVGEQQAAGYRNGTPGKRRRTDRTGSGAAQADFHDSRQAESSGAAGEFLSLTAMNLSALQQQLGASSQEAGAMRAPAESRSTQAPPTAMPDQSERLIARTPGDTVDPALETLPDASSDPAGDEEHRNGGEDPIQKNRRITTEKRLAALKDLRTHRLTRAPAGETSFAAWRAEDLRLLHEARVALREQRLAHAGLTNVTTRAQLCARVKERLQRDQRLAEEQRRRDERVRSDRVNERPQNTKPRSR